MIDVKYNFLFCKFVIFSCTIEWWRKIVACKTFWFQFYQLGLACFDELQKATYCLAQQRDTTECCLRNGVEPGTPCMQLCQQGKLGPFCGLQDILVLEACQATHYQKILSCFKDRMPQYPPTWQRNATFNPLFCDGFSLAGLQALASGIDFNK